MATRDQDRASLAFKHVDQFKPNTKEAKKYATVVHKLPALLQTAGLCQALHFVQSRKDVSQNELVTHMAEQLHRVNESIKDPASLMTRVRQADLSEYLQLTDEAMACAAWYRRMVQGVLKIEAGEEEEE